MEEYVYLGFVVVVGIIFAIQSYRTKKEALKRLEDTINKNYGNIPDKKYQEGELDRISSLYKYLKNKKDKENKINDTEYIDDITWNDLDMNEVFKHINNTYSSVGDEYLYNMLRTPQDSGKLKEFNRMVSWFYENEENAKEMQKKFSKIGCSKKVSLFEFIHRLDDLGKRSNLKHYIQILAFFAATAMLLTVPTVGIGVFIVVVAYNIITYYKQKSVVENYFICFKYLINIVILSRDIEKKLSDDFAQYKEEIKLTNKKLEALRTGLFLISDGMNGSIAEIIMDYVRMLLHLDIIKFNSMLQKTIDHIDEVDRLFFCMGKIEAAIAVASFRKHLKNEYEEFALPEIIENGKNYISFDNIYHPLIKKPVKNSLTEKKSVLLTGSNASGKSTFLKTVAINTILSRTIYTATADRMILSPFVVYSSMALRDDLKNQESYYIVEIKALKRIIDASKNGKPMLCFVDEVLRGTNTVERIAASSEILKSFTGSNVMCFAATHDIELTHILEKLYSNYHFEETIEDNDISFNYRLNSGRATTRNAIKLLKVIGYDNEIIEAAQQIADNFIKTGSW